jgi:hypothetical protein
VAKQALTEERIKALRPRSSRYTLKESPGLELRITPAGTKTFCCVYKARGRQHRVTLGRFPSLSLAAARQQVATLLEQKHTDPHTIAGLAARYVETTGNEDAERTFRLHVLPHIGRDLASRLGRGDVLSLLDKVKSQGRTIARDVHKHLRAMFYWAMDYELVVANPAARISKKRRPELRDRDDDGRALTDAELKKIWAATRRMGYPFGTIYQLTMLTGQRRGDWSDARWSEIRDDVLVIPAERYKVKTAGDHRVPLGRTVRAILRTLPRWEHSDCLFPVTRINKTERPADRPVSGFSKAAAQCETLSGLHVRPKDFRTTCRTRLPKLGLRMDVAERVLGHTPERLVRIYDKHDYETEKKAALELYARHMRSVVR